MQMYVSIEKKLAVLQLRSGLLPGHAEKFVTSLIQWCKEQKVSRIVSSTSSLAHQRDDKQLASSPFRYLATDGVTVGEQFTKLEKKEEFPGLYPGESPDHVFLPGSGYAKLLLKKCESSELECVIMSKFCEEGDNTRDGVELADYLNKLIGFVEGNKYTVPPSWKYLFGPPAPVEMFW